MAWSVRLLAVLIGASVGCGAFGTGTYAASGGDAGEAPDADTGSSDVTSDGGDASDAPSRCNRVAACKRVVFATSATFNGNLGGLDGADAKCNDAANAASAAVRVRGRAFKAWLSIATTSAAMRLVHGTLPYVLPDGTTVAANWDALVGTDLEALQAPIVADEANHAVAAAPYVRTTQPNGGAASHLYCVED